MTGPRAVVFLLLMLLTASLVAEADQEVPVERIVTLEVVTDAPHLQARELEQLGLAEGGLLDRRRVRDGTLALYAQGQVEYLCLEVVETEQGVQATLYVSHRARLERITITGTTLRQRWRIRDWLELRRGRPVSVGEVEAGVRRVLRELRSRGYPEAVVEPRLDYHRLSNTVTLILAVDTGEPELLGSVETVGFPADEEPLQVLSELEQGKRLSERFLERVRRRVVAELRRRGYWQAEVTGIERQARGGISPLEVTVRPGARYRLAVAGPRPAEELVVAAMPDTEDEGIHPAQTEALEELLREAMQREGRLLARVAVDLQQQEGEQTLQVRLDPDRERRVSGVDFDGVTSLTHEEVATVVRARAGRIRGWRGRELTDSTLEADRMALTDLYRARGFAEVEVAPPAILPEGTRAARIVFSITEGRRWSLVELRLEGFPVEMAAQLEGSEVGLVVGGPWDERQVEAERRRLELALADSGYPDGRVTAKIDLSTPGAARVTMRADAGLFVRIGEVVVSGLETVSEGVVRRAITDAGLLEGQPYTVQAMLEAQRRLYELGLFRHVEVVPIPGQERRLQRGLVVRCQEGDHRSFLLGAGWDTSDKLRITFGWSHLNLLGRAHAFSAEARVSTREQRYQLSLRQHRLPWLGEPGALVAYRTEEEYATYSQRRRGLWFEVGERRRRPLRLWLRYEYQIVRPEAPPEILSELERRDQETRISSITPSLEWDTRDDPLRPGHGTLASLSAEYAFPLLRADARFIKVQGGFTLYGPLLGGIAAVGIRAGAIHPMVASDDLPANLQVPLNVRFFAGGRASHRAFATDRLGIAGQTLDESGNAIGGNALLLLKAEWEHRLRGPVAGVVFVDAGNVWTEPNLLRWTDLRWGAGLGVRVDTPAGPLRLEYGYKLDRQPDESSGKLYLSFGVPF